MDLKQKLFMIGLERYEKVHHIVWSENIKSKPPTRVNDVKRTGEATIYYVGDNNYTAKIKVFPTEESPDPTHARYFSLLVAKHMDIKNSVFSEH